MRDGVDGKPSRQRLKRWRVALVVMHDDGLRQAISDVLIHQGYATEGARSLGEARDALRARVPALLVIDPGVHHASELHAFLVDQAAERRLPATMVLSDRGSALEVAAAMRIVSMPEPFDLADFEARLCELDARVDRKTARGRSARAL